jgi:alginate O-acetyltransferase complex protein AlgI
MSYTIDIYRGQLKPTRNVFHFFAYLSMFPQLVAGPIVRAADLLPQLEKSVPTSEKQRWDGTVLVTYGFFKKVVVADTLAPFVNAAFTMETPLDSCAYWWVIMVMFSFQIYCDFSGYSDIARGLAKWMGYEFPVNFDHPYISTSTREFWSRWHISLSSWFRDYVYIAMGGSRRRALVVHRNIWLTMMISGLWHGAAWTFVVWGALHALYLMIERVTDWPKRLKAIPCGTPMCVLIVFVNTLFAWVFFRADSFSQASLIFLNLINVTNMQFSTVAVISDKAILLVGLMIARHFWVYSGLNMWRWWSESIWCVRARPVAIGLLLVTCVFLRGPGSEFMYFQF